MLFVDLDDFKDVNDALGRAAGDELLRIVAERLVDSVRPGDLVARLGGDEFGVLLDGLLEPGTPMAVAERIVAAVAAPIHIGQHLVHVGASVGVAVRRERSSFESLVREADVAMYAAKARGKNRVERFDAHLDAVTAARLELKADIVGAAGRGELVVDFQPVIELAGGEIVGLEALVRWQHPTRGLLGPAAFIDVAEETGAIRDVGAWVLETAVRQLEAWRRRFALDDLWISVNVSVRQLEAADFAADVARTLAGAGLAAPAPGRRGDRIDAGRSARWGRRALATMRRSGAPCGPR